MNLKGTRENSTRWCFRRGEHEDVALYLLFFFIILEELTPCHTFQKYSKRQWSCWSAQASLPDLCMETHLSWDKFSSQNYTADFDSTYLQQPFFLWHHFCCVSESSKLLCGNTRLIESWPISVCRSTYRTGHVLIAYCWCSWQSHGECSQ